MSSLSALHLKNKAVMGMFNGYSVPAAYNDIFEEYKALRENVLLVDYSHMSIVSVMGEDAWSLVNHLISADISIIRDEQGMYSLVLNEDGTIRGDIYALCAAEGYYLLSEDIPAECIQNMLENILAKADELDIHEIPVIKSMQEDDWGTIMLEGPYSWEVMTEIYGFDIIGLPYYEYMNTDDGLMIFRCGKHGEFAYQLIGPKTILANMWIKLQDVGGKYLLKLGGLHYQRLVRIENTGWDESLFGCYTRNPIELQMQWAIEYDKEDFIGKTAVAQLSLTNARRKVVGIMPCVNCGDINPSDKVFVDELQVGFIVQAVYSPAVKNWIALALIDENYALSDIAGFTIRTVSENISAKTQSVPFIYNLSLLINPTTHSYVDISKAKSALLIK